MVAYARSGAELLPVGRGIEKLQEVISFRGALGELRSRSQRGREQDGPHPKA